jgi:hypothetical protein
VTDLTFGEQLFVTAREAVRRGCVERFKNAHPELPDAKKVFREMSLLRDTRLAELAHAALAQSRGPFVDMSTPFVGTVWIGGATATLGGGNFRRPLGDFVKLLHERGEVVAPKRTGWVFEPTTCTDGRRINESTVSMHALFLDCDGTGTWDKTLEALCLAQLAFVAYESGGSTQAVPKWRVVLPLARPFETADEGTRELWKQVYLHARIVFGAVGDLLGEGFDSATDTPCCPWFLTEKRDTNDAPRRIIQQVGFSLDIVDLIMALPPIEDQAPAPRTARPATQSRGLSDEKLNEIVDALSTATNNVPSGRHELYLALPGVLLDRGVEPDDVIAIIEAVSASYPRKHVDLHKDNIHNARTTIGRWQSGHNVTRIGTLNERWPTIAQAVDRVLPDATAVAMEAAMAAVLAPEAGGGPADSVAVTPPPPPKRKRRSLGVLGKEIKALVADLKKSPNAVKKNTGMVIERLLAGERFGEAATAAQVDELVCAAARTLGFHLPDATWGQVLDAVNASLHLMDFSQSIERMAAAETAFIAGQQQRKKWNGKQQAKNQKKLEEGQRLLDAAAQLRKAHD